MKADTKTYTAEPATRAALAGALAAGEPVEVGYTGWPRSSGEVTRERRC